MTSGVTSPPSPVSGDVPAPRGPWSFVRAACPGGFGRWGLHLLAGWLVFSLSTDVLWALHLKRLTGWSSLPSFWGETLTARDLWELLENAGLRAHWTGPWVVLAGGLALVWFLWAGWRLQAESAGLPARLGPWVWGLADALLVGAGPLAVVAGLLLWGLELLGRTGYPGLGWVGWVGSALVPLAFCSALFVHWWLCRLDRAAAPPGFRLGSWRRLGRHLALGYRRFWTYHHQWLALVLAGVVVRAGLSLLVLLLGWRLGGGTLFRIWIFLAAQTLAVLVNAWLLGWFLRLAALFVRQASQTGVAAAEP